MTGAAELEPSLKCAIRHFNWIMGFAKIVLAVDMCTPPVIWADTKYVKRSEALDQVMCKLTPAFRTHRSFHS